MKTPQFIIEQPAANDELFAHTRVANALKRAILDDARLRYVGLLGKWGSGKSTVIGIFERGIVAEEPNCLVLTFDAWEHQSDPPRRSFLEILESFLERELSLPALDKDLPNKDWRSAIRSLSTNTNETKTTTVPEVTKPGLLLLISVALLPVGLALIDKGTITAKLGEISPATTMFTIGWLLIALPFCVVGAFWAHKRTSGESYSVLSLLANKTPETKTELKTSASEPTAIEFQRILRSAIKAVSTKKKKLIIVVDNLDRLPPKEAIALWGTIRSMFLGPKKSEAERRSEPVILVPVDESVIKAAYNGEDRAEGSGAAFLDKTFDITFRVPPVVQSNWQSYATAKIVEVFDGAVAEPEAFGVVTVIDRKLGRQAQPTPRWVNGFVNKLATMRMQWSASEISLNVLAYYQLCSGEIEDSVWNFVSTYSPDLEASDPDWRRGIAAIYFGVAPPDAFQVLLDGPLREAIAGEDTIKFGELAQIKGFGSYFIGSLRAIRDDGLNVSVFSAAAVLDSLDNQEEPWVKASWRLISQMVAGQTYSGQLSEAHASALGIIAKNLSAPEATSFILLEWGRVAFRANASKPENLKPLLSAIDGLLEQAAKHQISLSPVELDQPTIYEQLLALGPSEAALTHLNFTGPATAIADRLQQRLATSPGAFLTPTAVQSVVAKYGNAFPWDLVASAAGEAVESGDGMRTGAGIEALVAIWPMFPPTTQRARALLAKGSLQSLLDEALANGVGVLAPVILSVFIRLGEAPHIQHQQGWSGIIAQDPNLAGTVHELVGTAASWPDLVNVVSRSGDMVLLLRTIAASWLSEGRGSELDGANVIENAGQYMALFNEKPAPFFMALMAKEDFWSSLTKDNLHQIGPLLNPLLLVDEHAKPASKNLQEAVGKFDVSWAQAMIRGGTAAYDLVANAALHSPPVGAVLEALRLLISNGLLDQNDEGFRKRWVKLVDTLDTDDQKALHKLLRDRLAAGMPVEELAGLVDLVGSGVLKVRPTRAQADGLVRNVVQSLLATPQGLAWLDRNILATAQWIRSSDQSTRSSLAQQLATLGGEGAALKLKWDL